MTEIPLTGCTPEPLMSYLKALGVFRLIAEQVDKNAKLSWTNGTCVLYSKLNREQITSFFWEEYQPTPIVGPWGGRSGFYPDQSESSARKALEAIIATSDRRFKPYRDTISSVRGILNRLGLRKKDDVEIGDNKLRLMQICRNELPDEILPWIDAVYVLTEDSRKFPPLLGTGGNEGSGSYVSTFAQRVVSLLLNRENDAGATTALFCDPGSVRSSDITVGQFSPGAIGGPNSSIGFEGGGGANPWDYLLAIEGTLLFAGASVRRLGIDIGSKVAFPFTVEPSPVGYSTSVEKEKEFESNKAPSRAELWMPFWDSPTSYSEVRHLFNEGRAQLGNHQARNGIEFARAAINLGVCRGVKSFARFGIFKRNGDSYFATFLGRFPVRQIPAARLIDQIDRWLPLYRRMANGEKTPPRFATAIRRIDEAVLNVCRYGDSPEYMQAVLRSLGKAERELANGVKIRKDFPGLRPLTGLSKDWLRACDDGSSEFRLATSLAFMLSRKNRHRDFRMYLEPVIRSAKAWTFDDTASGVVWSNGDLSINLANILIRRLQDGANEDSEDGEYSRHPLWVPSRFRPTLGDILKFIDKETDNDRLTDLLWALPAVSSKDRTFRFHSSKVSASIIPPTDYSLLKLIFLTEPITRPGSSGEVSIAYEPGIITLLRAERLDEAITMACRRLQVSGCPPYLTAPVAGVSKEIMGFPSIPERSRRLLAALLFPLRRKAVENLVKLNIRELEPNTL